MPALKDPDDDEMDPLGWLTGVRPRRRGENAGLLYAFGLGTFFCLLGLKFRFWPKRFEELFATPFILIGALLLLAAILWGTQRRRDGDGRWG